MFRHLRSSIHDCVDGLACLAEVLFILTGRKTKHPAFMADVSTSADLLKGTADFRLKNNQQGYQSILEKIA